jgi:hypothetical protein
MTKSAMLRLLRRMGPETKIIIGQSVFERK